MTFHSIKVDTADFSPNQFIAPDEARYPIGSDDTEQQTNPETSMIVVPRDVP